MTRSSGGVGACAGGGPKGIAVGALSSVPSGKGPSGRSAGTVLGASGAGRSSGAAAGDAGASARALALSGSVRARLNAATKGAGDLKRLAVIRGPAVEGAPPARRSWARTSFVGLIMKASGVGCHGFSVRSRGCAVASCQLCDRMVSRGRILRIGPLTRRSGVIYLCQGSMLKRANARIRALRVEFLGAGALTTR